LSRPLRRTPSLVLAVLIALALPAIAAQPKPSAKPSAKPMPAAPTAPATRTAPPSTPPPGADDAELDAIAAMVNDEPVLASDVEEQLFLFLQRNQMRPDSTLVDTLRRQILDQLIDDKLVLAEARRQAVTVTAADLNRQIDTAIAEAKERLGGEERFQEQLRRENTTEARLRERYKGELEQQMIMQRLVQRMFPRKPVPQAEAEAWFSSHRDRFPKVPPQLRLQVIQIVPTPDSARLKEGRDRIVALRRRISGGEKFAKVAAEASEDPASAQSGGDLGFFRRGQMEPAVEEAAFSLPDGGLSQPVRTPFGWHLVQPIERDTVTDAKGRDSLDVQGRPIVEMHARHILIRVTPNEADVERAVELAQAVREQAARGGDFAALVKRWSQYQGAAGPDGDVGFVSLGGLQPALRDGLADLQPGAISDVLPTAQGLNIFKVTERKAEREYELAEIREDLPEAVAQAQFREKYEAWLKTLRAKAQIEYR
jgi:peptidyl-prolyl cis-trans isomerase SurA